MNIYLEINIQKYSTGLCRERDLDLFQDDKIVK